MRETALRSPEDDYLIQVESFFLRRRGWGLMLSPRDWQRIKFWQSQGIPLRVALQGIDRALRQMSCTRGQVRSLAYCEHEVQQEWQVYLKNLSGDSVAPGFIPGLGYNSESSGGQAPALQDGIETDSFVVSGDIQNKLAEWRERVIALVENVQKQEQSWLIVVLKELVSSLDSLDCKDWSAVKAGVDHLNQWLLEQFKHNTLPSEMVMLEQQVRKRLKRYVSVMDAALLSQKQELLLNNLLMEKYGLSFLNSAEL